MKAEEIRDKKPYMSGSPGQMYRPNLLKDLDCSRFTAEMIREAAAQLAEMNEHLAKIANPLMEVVTEESPWVTLSLEGNPFVIDRREVTGVAPLRMDGAFPKVMIGMKGQAWSKSADGTVKHICEKLGIPIEGEK